MATSNIFNKTTTYISVQQVKDSTNIDGLIATNESTITRRILEAEKIIDNFISSYWEEADENQTTIFPTVEDGIPSDITEATLYIVEGLYTLGDQINNDQNQIVSESIGDHSVKYAEKKSIDSMQDLIPFKAKNILDQYGSCFTKQSLHQTNRGNVNNAVFVSKV